MRKAVAARSAAGTGRPEIKRRISSVPKTGNYVPQDWNTWQEENHDTQGTLSVGCKYKNR